MSGKIKESKARNNYGCYAMGAVRAERNGEYPKAAELWAKALMFTRDTVSRGWARRRLEFCSNAANRGWGVPA